MPEKLLSIKQVQEILGLSERTIFRLIKNGEIQGFKIGREWRFTEADINAYIEKQRQKARRSSAEDEAA